VCSTPLVAASLICCTALPASGCAFTFAPVLVVAAGLPLSAAQIPALPAMLPEGENLAGLRYLYSLHFTAKNMHPLFMEIKAWVLPSSQSCSFKTFCLQRNSTDDAKAMLLKMAESSDFDPGKQGPLTSAMRTFFWAIPPLGHPTQGARIVRALCCRFFCSRLP